MVPDLTGILATNQIEMGTLSIRAVSPNKPKELPIDYKARHGDLDSSPIERGHREGLIVQDEETLLPEKQLYLCPLRSEVLDQKKRHS